MEKNLIKYAKHNNKKHLTVILYEFIFKNIEKIINKFFNTKTIEEPI